MKIPRPCLTCGEVFTDGISRCKKCRPYAWPEGRVPMPPGWATTRRQKLRANPACEKCGRKATTVDHILARAFGGTSEQSNLQSLSAVCVKAKDAADRREGRRRAAAR
jgi:5-methylcytosine-specific restriction enzyme A